VARRKVLQLSLVIGVAAAIGGRVGTQLAKPGGASTDSPSVEQVPPTATVTVGSIQSVIVLNGAIVSAPPEPVRSAAAGRVRSVPASVGQEVERGGQLVVLEGAGDTEIRVTSPSAGKVSSILVAPGDAVVKAETVATVVTHRFLAVATVEPALLYRLYEPPVSIRAQIDHGPAPFDCPLVSLGANSEGAADPLAAPVQLTCQVPASVRAFAGVRVRLGVVTGKADGALTLPVEAVAGAADSGVVTLLKPDGSRVQRSVRLGLTDGLRVQIVDGLSAGDVVLDPPAIDSELAGGTPSP
jgi:macrolide-specific efflux system membrane fusion protein